jgi:hypothetical protein
MRLLTTSAALSAALFFGLAGASPSFAKGHSQGVGGNQTAGQGTAGLVDNGQSNSPDAATARGEDVGGPGRSGSSYGQVDASQEKGDNSNRDAAPGQSR